MAELLFKERLQPSLLDRLTDDEPEKQKEGTDRRVIDMKRLRELVLRDLAWLLNCERLETSTDLSEYPEVQRSVVNFGIPGMSGVALSRAGLREIERDIRAAIRQFEPRILSDSIQVSARSSAEEMSNRALSLEIEGELWAQPVPQRLLVRTEFDLDLGLAKVVVVEGN